MRDADVGKLLAEQEFEPAYRRDIEIGDRAEFLLAHDRQAPSGSPGTAPAAAPWSPAPWRRRCRNPDCSGSASRSSAGGAAAGVRSSARASRSGRAGACPADSRGSSAARNGIAPSIQAPTQAGRPRLMSRPKPGGISIAASIVAALQALFEIGVIGERRLLGEVARAPQLLEIGAAFVASGRGRARRRSDC